MVAEEAYLDQLQEFLVLLVEVHQDLRVHILAEREIGLLELQHQFLLKVILVDLLVTPIGVRVQEVEVLVVLEEVVVVKDKDLQEDLVELDQHHQLLDLLWLILAAEEEEVGVVLEVQEAVASEVEVVEIMELVKPQLLIEVVGVEEVMVMVLQDLVVLDHLVLLSLLTPRHK